MRIRSMAAALLGFAAVAQAQDIPDDMAVEAIDDDRGEMQVGAAGGDLEIDDRLVFEPLQSFEEMFQRDDVVFLMRHGPTDWSFLDEKAVAPADCENQRVMDEAGREDMRNLGALLASNGILPSRIVRSEWCRNRQTVEALLAGLGRVAPDAAEDMPVEVDPELNLLLSLQGAPDVTELRERIAAWDGDPDRAGPLLLVSHFTNIQELTQFSVFEGEILVIDPDRDNRVLGYVRLASASPDVGHFAEAMASPLMSEQAAIDMVRRYYDALNRGDEEVISNVLSEQWVIYGADEEALDRDDYDDEITRVQDALGDATFAVEEVFFSDDVATVLGRIEGQHEGTILGFEPTGRDVSVDIIEVHRIEDGRIAETWGMADRLGLRQQIAGERGGP